MVESPSSGDARPRRIAKDLSKIREKIVVSDLARELAHELNNPLEALVNLVYLARKRPQDDETKSMLDEAESQLNRVSVIINSILTLEKSNHEQRLRTAGTILDPAAFRRIKQEYESALHLASIIENAYDAIYSKKLDGTIMAWNAGAERLFGYSAEEALGKSVMMLVPPDLSREEREILEKIRSGTMVRHFETLRRAKGGIEVRVSVSVSPIRNKSGKVVGASTIARDLSPEIPIP